MVAPKTQEQIELFRELSQTAHDIVIADSAPLSRLLSINGDSQTLETDPSWTVAAAASITEAEVDFGSIANQTEKSFTIVDAGVSPTSYILVQIAGVAPTGRSIDEVFFEDFSFVAQPGTGQFDLLMKSLHGSVSGKYKVWYQVGA